jgi:hypothetical protein
MIDPESVFGQLKNNRGFRRFLLRGMSKVTLEVGWLSLAHNPLKQAANDQKRRAAILQYQENRCSADFYSLKMKGGISISENPTYETAPCSCVRL